MKQYLELLRTIKDNGTRQANRTGIDAITMPGAAMQFDLIQGFPLLTTKKMAFKALKGELIAFLRAAESAADFRALGCNFWDQNANENQAWLKNPLRKGTDDLGRIYGAQWRNWQGKSKPVDQVLEALYSIHNDPTNRRIIINAWRPDEFHQMALPPCHVLYQFLVNVERKEINLCMYQRSCDMFLGVPMNIGSAALLLTIFGHLTGYTPRFFTHFLADAHIYVNHLDQVAEQLAREPKKLPRVTISDRIPAYDGVTFRPDLIDMIEPDDILLENYDPHPLIKAPMAV